MKKIRIVSLAIICLLLFIACSSEATMKESFSGNKYDSNLSFDAAPSTPDMPRSPGHGVSGDVYDKNTGFDSESISNSDKLVSERKLIKNGSFTVETLEYEKTISAIEKLISDCGGYVQNSNVSGTGSITYQNGYHLRRATYTIRIPADRFGNFEESLASCGSVLSRTVTVDEVSNYYYDCEARLSSLKVQEEQLLELMKDAKDLTAIIMLQEQLSKVRYEIESLQGTLRRLDNQIAFSTVNIYINEVSQPTVYVSAPKTLGERISYSFHSSIHSITESAKDFTVFILGNIIFVAFWAIIIIVAVILIRRRIKRCKAKKMQACNNDNDTSK